MKPAQSLAACPRCQRTTLSPFGGSGVCLRCAGTRALAIDLDPSAPAAEEPTGSADAGIPAVSAGGEGTYSPFGSIPERIGPYEIIDEIGRGGMGRIFAARQPRLDRLVALKALALGPASEALEQRFLREIQTVARLRHPHIVAVHDSGRADGFVYFAMDYIEGGDLARRQRDQPLSLRPLVAILEKIVRALAYAHGEGVLHRDLKPSNILLDGDEPRLADFGLAAQLEAGGDLTMVSAVLGTPRYLAPEVVKHGSGAFTPASDLYAIGVILYAALAGRTPFAGATAAELPALLEQVEPPPLRLLAPATPRDVETICLKCLQRDPARRYPEAAALAEDLRRWLAGEPILARPPGAGEKLARFARRHRTALAAATIATGALVTATVISTAWALRATRAERRAATEADKTRAYAEFLEHDILLPASPAAHPDRDLKLRTALDTAAKRIDARFAAQPAVEAALRETLGQTYFSLGEYGEAVRHQTRAYELRRALEGDAPATWRAATRLAASQAAQARYADATATLAPALAAQRRVLGSDHPDTFAALAALARIQHGEDKLGLALATRRDLLARQRRTLGHEHPDTLMTANLLATTLLDLGQFSEAAALLEPTAAASRQVRGPDDPATLEALNNLAGAYWAMGRLDAAEPLFRETIAASRRVLGSTHPDTCAVINNLAFVLRSQGKLVEALATYNEALTGFLASVGPEHHEVMRVYGSLGAIHQQLGQLTEARAFNEKCLATAERVLGEHHAEVASARDTLASVLIAQGEFAAAEPLLRRAIADHQAHDERPMATYTSRSYLGECLTGLGRLTEAEVELLAADAGYRPVAEKLTPTQRRTYIETSNRLAKLYHAWNRPADAQRWRERYTELRTSQ